ncbi:MAG: putative sulfate exporter family transporter, partial [Rhodospirillaceae bacterium]|nr:putative sulfate exporter family transporter [Rhodospirillaceae bacterium]
FFGGAVDTVSRQARATPRRDRARRLWEGLRRLAPGLIVAGTISLAAMFLSDHYGGPVMLFALLLGMAFNFLSQEGPCVAGVNFASKTILRCGVALLGARITAEEVLGLGAAPFIVVGLGVTTTILLGIVLARWSKASSAVGFLTGGAVAICGASAALAISAILPKGAKGIAEKDTIVTVIGVTALSTVAMIAYPIVAKTLGFDMRLAGIFLGSTIHDVAQVVGAGYSLSTTTGDVATVTKLLRVAMLVPVVLLASTLLRFHGTGESHSPPLLPLFLVGFVLLATLNSLGWIPASVRGLMTEVSRWALIAAIAALGIKTSLKDLMAVGPRILILLGAETAWIAVLSIGALALF